MSAIITNESLEKRLPPAGNDDGDNTPQGSAPVEDIDGRKLSKAQPWKKIWPNAKPAGTQMQVYGFKKGEVMEILGNAGNFFAHGDWEVEHDTSKHTESSADETAVRKSMNLPHSLVADCTLQ
jgi:hypothetical protein